MLSSELLHSCCSPVTVCSSPDRQVKASSSSLRRHLAVITLFYIDFKASPTLFEAAATMELSIVMLDGTSFSLSVKPQDTVGSLKTLIRDKTGVPPERQKLVFANGHTTTLSNDSLAVCSYGLQSGSQVSLLVIQPATIQVFLKNEKGKMTTYDVTPDETVRGFKEKVQCREGVQVSQQRLVHQSQDMEDGRLLSYYGVKNHSTIQLMLRLRGG